MSTTWSSKIRRYSTSVLGLVSLALWFIAVDQADFLRMGASGLITVLGWPYFAGLALLTVALGIELMRAPLRTSVATALIAVLVLFIFGTACAVEPVASLTDSWIHAGFIQYFIQNGHTLNNYDARFSWPGGFAMAAVFASFVGKTSVVSFLRWFPLFIELMYLAPLLVIARFSGVDRRTGLLGVVLFYVNNWIYQDYFSPQGLNYLFFLVVIAAVLACWRPRYAAAIGAARSRWRERLSQTRSVFTLSRIDGRDATSNWSSSTTLGVLVVLALICFASAISHQLTPYALILALAACLVGRRLGRIELLIVASILAVGWLSLGASNYWIGHLADIFGSAGKVSSTIGSNVVSRVTGNSDHLFIVKVRILITVAFYLLAGIGTLRRFADSRVLEILAAVPFVLVVAQNYGGEGLLRVVLFGLPFTALLAASALLPASTGTIRGFIPPVRIHRRVLICALVIVILVFALGTTLVRGGNDSYESFSKGELAAANYAYNHARAGQTIGEVAAFLPLGQEKITSVYTYIAAGAGTPYKSLRPDFLKVLPRWIILSQSQEAWGELVANYPRGWEETLEVGLIQKGYRIVAHWPTSTVLELAKT